MKPRQKVFFFTAKHVSSFVQLELKLLTQHFDVFLICGSDVEVSIEGVRLLQVKHAYSSSQRLIHLLQFGHTVLPLFFDEVSSFGFRSGFWVHLMNSLRLLIDSSMRCESLRHQLSRVNAVNYAFFGNDYALLLALAKRRGYINQYVFRVHGRDVIEEREPITQRLPFQWLKFREAKAVYGVSNMTANYLKDRYPEYKDKFKVSYLGSEDRGVASIPLGSEYTVISIGRVRNIKRFHLVGELAKNSMLPIKWIHIGDLQTNDPDVELFQTISTELMALDRVKVEHKGHLVHNEFLEFLKETPIDLIINTSSYEGLPVSIQEALSFGIPCMATDVGGTSDIVNATTGLLMPAFFDPKHEAERMDAFLMEKARDEDYRRQVRLFWEQHLNAKSNFEQFCNSICEPF